MSMSISISMSISVISMIYSRNTLSSPGLRPVSAPSSAVPPGSGSGGGGGGAGAVGGGSPSPQRVGSQRRRGSMTNLSMVDAAKAFIRYRIG
jgi:hypothetical protein